MRGVERRILIKFPNNKEFLWHDGVFEDIIILLFSFKYFKKRHSLGNTYLKFKLVIFIIPHFNTYISIF